MIYNTSIDRAIVSNPEHARYGQHLTESEVNELIKPTDEALELVHEWLADYGVQPSELEYSPAKDWIKLSLPVSDVENLLDTEFSVFEHEEGGYIVRTPEWSLPQHLHEHIDVIQPTNSFFRARAMASTLKYVKPQGDPKPPKPESYPSNATLSEVCDENAVTPLCLRTLYGTVDYVVQAAGKNKVGLNDFLGESNNRSDVSLFLQRYRPEAVKAAHEFDVVVIAGGTNDQSQENATALENGTELEGNLDAETILGISWPTPLTAFTTGGSPPYTPDLNTPTDTNEPYLTWLQYVLSHPNPPQVISTSYDDDEQTVPLSYATSVCNGFAQLGARGISLLFAAGDSGVGGDVSTCVTNDGKNKSTFLPEFPSTCPYITAVGATMNHSPEVVAYDPENGFVGGGGFSTYFKRPSYQDNVVPKYVKSLDGAFSGLYNENGRGYPDISAQGFHFITTWNGTDVLLDGTSAATPAASAVIALINDALIAAGKPPLGFLNPWLYSKGYKAFTDITSGTAMGCGTDGFPAQKGWDAASGWGTPVSLLPSLSWVR